MSDSLQPHESQHARPPCPSPTPGVHPDSRPLSQWCHPAISFFVVPFSSCPQSLPASESFPMSQLFTWGGQSIGVGRLYFLSFLSLTAFKWAYLSFYPLPFASLLFTGICKASSDICFVFFISFSWWWSWSLPPIWCYKPPSIVLQALYQI